MKIGSAVLIMVLALFSAQTTTNFFPVTDGMLEKPDPGDWLMWRRTLDGWGYSPLNEINKRNVARLKMVWKREMTPGIQEGTPLVYRGTMYLPNPADVTQAINAATGDLIWNTGGRCRTTSRSISRVRR